LKSKIHLGFEFTNKKEALSKRVLFSHRNIGKHELEESGEPEQKEETHEYPEEVEG
jgi:hypothetical protein